MLNSNLPSIHSDVLSANPETNELKRNLISEIKNRAKGSLTSKNYPEAIELYSKGIEVSPEEDNVEKSILFANRSMCHASMGNHGQALSDAQSSIDLNSQYTKAYFRKTTALIGLNRYEEARSCVLTGLSQLPNDKDLQAQLNKIDTELKKKSTSSSTSTATSKNTSTKPTQKSPTEKSTTSTTTTSEDMDVEEEANLEKEIVRGYKKLPDGRVTTFFNNSLDDKTKELIGDIAPKKLDSLPSDQLPSAATVGSSWNAAGTFESKELTPWAKETLNTSLHNDNLGGEILLSSDSISAVLHIVEVKDLNGDAQIIVTRGKRKHVCDFTFTLVWKVDVAEYDGTKKQIEGTLLVEDFSADGEYDHTYTITSKNTQSHTLVPTIKNEILTRVKGVLDLFITELKAK